MIKFNVNDNVRVKLTDVGKEVLNKHWGYMPNWYNDRIDEKGYMSFQLHELMNIFGESVYNGCEIPFETTILIKEYEEVKRK